MNKSRKEIYTFSSKFIIGGANFAENSKERANFGHTKVAIRGAWFNSLISLNNFHLLKIF
jgi:hypothetical protein